MSRVLPPVDDDVFEALQNLAEPLVDDVNSVLRRLLGLHAQVRLASQDVALQRQLPTTVERPATLPRGARRGPNRSKKAAKSGAKRTRAPRGSLLPESEYELPILRFLEESGGRAPASEVVDAVGRALKDSFTDVDKETIESGDVRWKSRVQFVRLKLIRTGDMAREAPRGVWAITDQGARRAKANG